MDDDKKASKKEEIEKTMACAAFAEAGEECPIEEKKGKKAEKSSKQSIETDMACAAFAEAGEPCPLDKEKNNS